MEEFDRKYEKKHPFLVPEAYFTGLEENVMRRIREEKTPSKKSLTAWIIPYVGIAAAIAAIWFLVPVALSFIVDDDNRMLESHVLRQQSEDEIELDKNFNPTDEEIYEYLSTETKDYDFIYADLF